MFDPVQSAIRNPQSAIDVSVVVVSWNGRRHLDACLSALAAQEDIEFEVVLVDNASTDGTAEYVGERYPWVRLVRLAENRGFAGGNNAGVAASSGNYVALLNNDTRADRRWLVTLRHALTEHPRCGLATSRIVYMDDPSVVDSAGDGMTRSGGAFKRGHGRPAADFLDSREVFGVCGAACMMSRRLFDELGRFDEDFFASHEDVDLSYRARLRGIGCFYAADAIVQHVGSATLGAHSAFAVFHGQRNLEWVYVKNTPPRLLARTVVRHLVYDVAAGVYFARHGLLGTFLRAKWAAFRALPRMVEKRRLVQRRRTAADRDLWNLFESGWLRLKVQEKRFDVRLADHERREA